MVPLTNDMHTNSKQASRSPSNLRFAVISFMYPLLQKNDKDLKQTEKIEVSRKSTSTFLDVSLPSNFQVKGECNAGSSFVFRTNLFYQVKIGLFSLKLEYIAIYSMLS